MLGNSAACLSGTGGFCIFNGHISAVRDFHVRAICHCQTACGVTDGQRTASRAFRLFRVCFRSFGLFYTAADGQVRFCTRTGARTVTCAAIAHTDTLDIDILCKDTLFLVFNCLGAINGILLAFQGKVHIGIVLYIDTRLTVLCQVNLGIIQRQVNLSSFVIIFVIQIHADIDTMAAGGQVGVLDCQVNICTLAHLDDGFIPCVPGIRGYFSRGAGIYIHAVNHDGCTRHILFDRDGVWGCGLSRGAVFCVVARRICDSIRRGGFLCAIVGGISAWRDYFRWPVAVLDVDRTISSFLFILVDVGAVIDIIRTLITVRAAIHILVNSYTAIAQIIRHRRSTGANRAHCNRSSQRHCCQLEFLVCHFLLLLSSSCSHDRKVVVKQQADPLSTVFLHGNAFLPKAFPAL